MTLRSPRILGAGLAPTRVNQGRACRAERPEGLPQTKPATSRDDALQTRLRQIAARQAATQAAAEPDECKRRVRRKQTSLPGLITFKSMRLQVPCTIADMSGTGARLKLPAGASQSFGDLEHLPDRITLVLRADRMQVDCEIKWRRTGSLGVRFLGPPVPLG